MVVIFKIFICTSGVNSIKTHTLQNTEDDLASVYSAHLSFVTGSRSHMLRQVLKTHFFSSFGEMVCYGI